MSPRIVITKALGSLATLAFVVVFNFFLFRIVEQDPVANLFRGRNLTDAQRDELTSQFGLDGSKLDQFWAYLQQTLQLNFGRSYVTNQPVWDTIVEKAPATIALVGVSAVLSAVFGTLIGIAAAWRRNSKTDYASTSATMTLYSMPDFWLGMLLLTVFAVALGWFPVGGIEDPTASETGVAKLLDQAHHMFLPALTLTLGYLGEYALVMRSSLIDTMREDYLVLARAKGLRDVAGAQPPRGAERAAAGRHARRDQLRLRAVGGDRGRDDLLLAGPRARRPTRRSRAPTCRCCRACSSCSAPR